MTDLATQSWLTVMGFDYGHKRLGIAVGQTLTATAQPLATVNPAHWPQIDELIKHWQPQACIVGQPRFADGHSNAITVAVTEFTQKLYQRYRLPVHTIDETLSSVTAAQ
ncbi:MAG: Holliday junction resolvase RuvX, partial [Pseudomonadota bacterium]|nr:Holliday junction resolvase RuvX [Pseudomonadota bacterium]